MVKPRSGEQFERTASLSMGRRQTVTARPNLLLPALVPHSHAIELTGRSGHGFALYFRSRSVVGKSHFGCLTQAKPQVRGLQIGSGTRFRPTS